MEARVAGSEDSEQVDRRGAWDRGQWPLRALPAKGSCTAPPATAYLGKLGLCEATDNNHSGLLSGSLWILDKSLTQRDRGILRVNFASVFHQILAAFLIRQGPL